MITKRKELIPIWSSRPNNSLFSLHRQLSDLFGDVFEGFEPTASLSEKLGGFYPKTNVVDTPQALEISPYRDWETGFQSRYRDWETVSQRFPSHEVFPSHDIVRCPVFVNLFTMKFTSQSSLNC